MGTTGQSITLANSIIGVGILAMPFCFQQCGVLLATLILLSMGLISRLCCYFLLKSALLARKRNFEFLAFHVFGSAGKMAVEVGIIGFLMGTCIAYFVVVGDLGPQIIAKMFNINQSDILRTSIMVIVSLVCVLPLGLLRNVDSLSNVSAATIAFYFCLVMKVITEAGAQLLSSDWHRRVELWRAAGVLQCVPIFSMALFCQAQLFEIFESLPSLSLEKMNVVTKNAINICTGVYFTLGVFGYIAFSSQDISGNILMSLSPTMASDVIKLGFVMSLAFSFPLIIFPCRASLYSFLYKKMHSSHHDHIINHSIPETTFRCITVAIIAVALFISLLLPNIELVLGLLGSTIGVLICVVFPAACFVNVTFKNTNERILAKGILFLGLIIMVLGTYANLQAAENQRVDRYEDKYTQERIDKIVEDFFESRGKEEVFIKPKPKTDPIPNESFIVKPKDIKESKKDSEVQPPNPVPPESQSNEKVPPIKKEEKIIPIENKSPTLEVKDTLDKISELHPKNIKPKLEAKLQTGDSIVDKPQPKPDIKPPSNEDKIDMIKQQKLIETIKQHGEEQKELIKEQKEILDEIYKTKQELQKNKQEDNNEAKKIAVESIKQIANMAIQSIGGVTEKPNQVDVKKNDKKEQLEKLTNEAVQEIAKKVVETIEAIQEIKNPEPPAVPAKDINSQSLPNQANGVDNINPVQNNEINQNVPQQQVQPIQQVVQNGQPLQQVVQNGQPLQQVVQNGQPIQNIVQQQQQNVQENNNNQQFQLKQNAQMNENIPLQNFQGNQNVNSLNMQPIQNNQLPLNQQGINNIPMNRDNVDTNINNANINQQPQSIETQNKAEAKPQANIKQTFEHKKESIAQILNNNIQQIQLQNQNKNEAQVKSEEALKLHSHGPDEPQSYKQGEDTQVKPSENEIVQNVPLPIAVNQNQAELPKKPAAKANENINLMKANKVQMNGANQNEIHRQKREVIDCTQKVTLKPEDKQICDTLIDHPKEIPEIEFNKIDTIIDNLKQDKVILPEADMNKIALPKDLPLDANILQHYMSRSLKSYDKDER